MNLKSRSTKVGLVAAGLISGVVLASTIGAQAATAPSASTTPSATADAHPGDNGADGIPESQEAHGGHGLDLSGTVTAVSSNSVTIKTATATTEYSIASTSDIDRNGEATLSALKVGDVVTFSVQSSNAKQIDKLHAGDEAKDMPQQAAPSTTGSGA